MEKEESWNPLFIMCGKTFHTETLVLSEAVCGGHGVWVSNFGTNIPGMVCLNSEVHMFGGTLSKFGTKLSLKGFTALMKVRK